jgi:membrane-associated phospholipid phosphatase
MYGTLLYRYMLASVLLYVTLVTHLFKTRFVPHAVAMVGGTALLVLSGVDFAYHRFVIEYVPMSLLFVADIMGFLVPIATPGILLIILMKKKKRSQRHLYMTLIYTSILTTMLGWTLSTILKAFTGRTSPPHQHAGREFILSDNSRDFHFGFMQEQVIGGWPSSHATIAFAFATAWMMILPRTRRVRVALLIYALFVGFGVTFGFHWFSEFFAGALLGIAIGTVAGEWGHRRLLQAKNTPYASDRG